MPYLEQTTTFRSPLEIISPIHAEQNSHWLTEYEKRPDSIFRYYSLENEVEFLKKAEGLSLEKRNNYVQENVKRFLGEFVGKIPYTTIPYEVGGNGFSYAGLHVMDSYRTAARLGGDREKAETSGFEEIERQFKKNDEDVAFWISPPKIADYGFIFVLEKNKQGWVKEYILRYPEKIDKLEKSSFLFSHINPNEPVPTHTDEYLLHPIFGKNGGERENIEEIMRLVGIDEQQIHASGMFEKRIDASLGIWIKKYSDIMCSLASISPRSFLYEKGLIEAKKILLTIYQKAEEIKNENILTPRSLERNTHFYQEQLSQHVLYERAGSLQNNTSFLPVAAAGSCPTVSKTNPLENGFIANNDVFNSITNGSPPEQFVQKKKEGSLDCTCPHCKQRVKAIIANGTITCPRKECGKSAPYAC